MKIEINKCSNLYDFYNEVYGIARIYYKKLCDKPHKKIIPIVNYYAYYSLFCFLMIIIDIFAIKKYNSVLFYISLGIFMVCIFLGLIVMFRYITIIKKMAKQDVNSILTIDDEKVVLENKNVHQTNEISWNKVKYILITKKSIGFMPYDDKKINTIIFCNIEYLDEIKKAIKKYKKEDLIVKN